MVVGALLVTRVATAGRAREAEQFAESTATSAAFVASYLQAQEALGRAEARELLGTPRVPLFRLQLVVRGLRYQAGAVLSGRGVLEQAFPYRPALIGESFGVRPNAVQQAARLGQPAVSQVLVSPVLHIPAVAIAVPYPASRGHRIFAGVFTVRSVTLARLVRQSVGVTGTRAVVIDGVGNIVTATSGPPVSALSNLAGRNPALASALRQRPAGGYTSGPAVFSYASAPIARTPWRLVMDVPSAVLYQSVNASERSDNWLLAGLGAVGLAGALALAFSSRQRSERERAASLARERAARVEAHAARERLDLLLGAGDLVAATGSRQELLDRAAQLAVPALADLCVVFVPAGQGILRAGSVVHRDPAGAAILQELRGVDLPAAGPLIGQMAFTEAATQLVPDVRARAAEWARAAPEVARIIRRVPHVSALATPLLIGHRPVGVAVLGRGGGRAAFTEADMPVITEFARRLAAGLANAETFAREHTVAETLQHALLPGSPPEIAGLDLAASYLPAADGVHVGGDWYDAFPVGRGRVGLAVGDVGGHSIGSASIMGQLRSMLRTCAFESPHPPDVLRRTNTVISQLLPEALATVFYAVLDLPAGDLRYASAGHPPALAISAGGHAEYLDDTAGVMLGAAAGTAYTAGHRRLAPGAGLLLYTDGLIEDRQRDIGEGLSTLASTMRRAPARTAEQMCQAALTTLGASAPADDVCVLAVRLLTPAGPSGPPGTAALAPVRRCPGHPGGVAVLAVAAFAEREPAARWRGVISWPRPPGLALAAGARTGEAGTDAAR